MSEENLDIVIKNLNKSFGDHQIFENFSAEFKSGEIVALTGPSGCGKTTLLRIIAGLCTDFKGDVLNVPENISYLFQEDRLLAWKNVYHNIDFVVKDLLSKEQIETKIDELLSFSYLKEHKHKFPHELSGGMQRRVALCRSFIYPSDLLIMDEPFSGLDADMKGRMADSFLSLVKGNQTAILVTHDSQVIDKCNRIISL
jgi:NitT/TauT family transport system ATP-binding protein